MTTVTFLPLTVEDRIVAIRSLAEQGRNTNEIADTLGLSYGATYSLARKNGIQIARKMKVGDISGEIAELSEQGMTIAEIAQKLNVSDSTIRKSAKENGITVTGRKAVGEDGNPLPMVERISEKRKQRLVLVEELFTQGVRAAEIARQLGFTREMIRQDLELLNISASESNQQKIAVLSERVKELAEQGLTVSEIAASMKISVIRVRSIADKFEISISRLKAVDHGTILSYQRGCTCELCREANSQLARVSRERRIEKGIPDHLHGTDTGYRNWQCKCDPCKAAGSDTNRKAAIVPGLAASKKHTQWSQEEDRKVQDRSLTARQLAVILDRTVGSINTRRAILKRVDVSPAISR